MAGSRPICAVLLTPASRTLVGRHKLRAIRIRLRSSSSSSSSFSFSFPDMDLLPLHAAAACMAVG